MTNVVITSAARTAIGSYGKSLAGVTPSDLGATAAKAAIERSGITPEQIEHVVFGNVIHTETADAYMARVVGMKAGVPKETPAFTVNRLWSGPSPCRMCVRRTIGSVTSMPAAAQMRETFVELCSAISPQTTLPRARPPWKVIR